VAGEFDVFAFIHGSAVEQFRTTQAARFGVFDGYNSHAQKAPPRLKGEAILKLVNGVVL
jgi:hypothetical protein